MCLHQHRGERADLRQVKTGSRTNFRSGPDRGRHHLITLLCSQQVLAEQPSRLWRDRHRLLNRGRVAVSLAGRVLLRDLVPAPRHERSQPHRCNQLMLHSLVSLVPSYSSCPNRGRSHPQAEHRHTLVPRRGGAGLLTPTPRVESLTMYRVAGTIGAEQSGHDGELSSVVARMRCRGHGMGSPYGSCAQRSIGEHP
jgi:hypothetical protein